VRIIHDADSHVMETREWLDPLLDDDLKARLRPLYGRKPNRIDKILDKAKAREGDPEAEAAAFTNPIAGPAGEKSPGHPDFDQIWARLSETDTPFVLHIGRGTKTQP
jgi:hypothetical protein